MVAQAAAAKETDKTTNFIAGLTKTWYARGVAGKNKAVALGNPFVKFARHKVASGEFGSTSEVVREAMGRYIAEDTKLEKLKSDLQKGLDSGPARAFDWDEFMERKFSLADDG